MEVEVESVSVETVVGAICVEDVGAIVVLVDGDELEEPAIISLT